MRSKRPDFKQLREDGEGSIDLYRWQVDRKLRKLHKRFYSANHQCWWIDHHFYYEGL